MENFYILGAFTCLMCGVFAVLAWVSDKISEKSKSEKTVSQVNQTRKG